MTRCCGRRILLVVVRNVGRLMVRVLWVSVRVVVCGVVQILLQVIRLLVLVLVWLTLLLEWLGIVVGMLVAFLMLRGRRHRRQFLNRRVLGKLLLVVVVMWKRRLLLQVVRRWNLCVVLHRVGYIHTLLILLLLVMRLRLRLRLWMRGLLVRLLLLRLLLRRRLRARGRLGKLGRMAGVGFWLGAQLLRLRGKLLEVHGGMNGNWLWGDSLWGNHRTTGRAENAWSQRDSWLHHLHVVMVPGRLLLKEPLRAVQDRVGVADRRRRDTGAQAHAQSGCGSRRCRVHGHCKRRRPK